MQGGQEKGQEFKTNQNQICLEKFICKYNFLSTVEAKNYSGKNEEVKRKSKYSWLWVVCLLALKRARQIFRQRRKNTYTFS